VKPVAWSGSQVRQDGDAGDVLCEEPQGNGEEQLGKHDQTFFSESTFRSATKPILTFGNPIGD